MTQTECIGPMKLAMKLRRDMIGVAAETLNRMFQQQEDALIEQVQKCSIERWPKDNWKSLKCNNLRNNISDIYAFLHFNVCHIYRL